MPSFSIQDQPYHFVDQFPVVDGIIKYVAQVDELRNVAIHEIVVHQWNAIHSRIINVSLVMFLLILLVGLHAFNIFWRCIVLLYHFIIMFWVKFVGF